MIKQICEVDPKPLISKLDILSWNPCGGRKGVFAMIEKWPQEFDPSGVFSTVMALYPNHTRGLSMISKLMPAQIIEEHTDHHDRSCPIRIHVPLQTNAFAMLKVGGVIRNLEVGWSYEINPTLPHSAWNYGDEERIHLMFNLIGENNGVR